MIASVEATEGTVGDALMLEPLKSSVERGLTVKELSADKAYLSNEILTAVEAERSLPVAHSGAQRARRHDVWAVR